ncbi:Alginate lyase [Thermoflexales bacterium]|nr:Alginate lyase [Thermoflexales bacterium]
MAHQTKILKLTAGLVGPLFLLLLISLATPQVNHVQATPLTAANSTLIIDDFENVADWSGLTLETNIVHNGSGAGRWGNQLTTKSIRKVFSPTLNASNTNLLQFWLYSGVANNAPIELIFDSDNAADPAGWDYYHYSLTIDWTGWRRFRIPLADFTRSRNPLGWNQLNYVRFSADGWGHTPLSDTLLILDDMALSTSVISDVLRTTGYQGANFVYTYTLRLANSTGTTRLLTPSFSTPPGYPFQITALTPNLTLPANGTAQAVVRVTVPASAITPQTALTLYHAAVILWEAGVDIDSAVLDAAVPLAAGARSRPQLLLNTDDLARIQSWKTSQLWASTAYTHVIQAADGWPRTFTQTYYLTDWALPPEGGQWSMWYLCSGSGTYLRYDPPGIHVCPTTGQTYAGWPYDQVIYGRMHSSLAQAALNLGLAYRFTSSTRYATSAAAILRAYADRYLTYPYHDINNQPNRSGGRVQAQTLDESIWLVPIAWAYDLIADSPALTANDRTHIERDLLQAAATTIGRYPAGESNWQSWHNAGLGAVGFTLDDPVLIAQALRDPNNGFDFQMQHSVSSDGFWYEGSWSYHFFALSAHRYLAEMAARAGANLYNNARLHGMFAAPLRFAMPDGNLPLFNDSGSVSLIGQDSLYESAYQRYGEAQYLAVLGQRTRGRDALLWGVESLPAHINLNPPSTLFPDAGYAVLRADHGSAPVYAALHYGPHGGGHGHYDKLGLILFARGMVMGVDPGTQSYAAPTHNTWDKQTIAHNTVVIDGRTQAEATGALHRFTALPGLSMTAADAGAAYTATNLLRTILVSPDYVLDRFRVRATDGHLHAVDWIYHNAGTPTTTLPLTAYHGLPTANGYQHLTHTLAVTTAQDWQIIYGTTPPPGTPYGNIWTSPSDITATFTFNQEQAFQGSGSGRLTYDFTSTSGYIMYNTPQPPPLDEAPQRLRLALRGDGSSNTLALRVYDATEERFSCSLGAMNWSGWRVITTTNIVSCTHFLGNNDGFFDLPVKQVSIQLDSAGGSPVAGAFYVDDITLLYPTAGDQLVEDFEIEPRGLRLQMLGETGTTVVMGEGLGPDMKPVPFALARRQAVTTTFASLLEPISSTPFISSFVALPTNAPVTDEAGAFAVTSPHFEDHLLAVAAGPAGLRRTFGAAACDGTLCLVRRSAAQQLLRLILADGTQLEGTGTTLIHSQAMLPGLQVDYANNGASLQLHTEMAFRSSLHIWAPTASSVFVNERTRAFTRDGNYVVIAADYWVYLPVVRRNE